MSTRSILFLAPSPRPPISAPKARPLSKVTGSRALVVLLIALDGLLVTGSVSSIGAHISCHEDHHQVYGARCVKVGIQMNQRAIPKTADSQGSQGKLDSIVAKAHLVHIQIHLDRNLYIGSVTETNLEEVLSIIYGSGDRTRSNLKPNRTNLNLRFRFKVQVAP
ncbi:hypothetical protein DFH08DRAFT_827379 [Mycena albidolilacea]|uniref:Uncharacterized protein n=1 Tax=Mycena albidolilacea TaxID=1033008 RepID=A0AAD6YYK2_9AGAR|nr:hypothetical protein DFH08DRAFT_827379 [Mycena albidolilacea]